MEWIEFIAAFVVFFLSHSIPVRPSNRARLVRILGRRGFTIAYSLLSLGVLAWIIGAAGRAPYVPLWDWAAWQNHVVLAAMGLVCLLLALSIGQPNPLSFGGAGNDRFNPDQPGIVGVMRHPLLVSLAIWAFAHLVPNGDLAHIILFGAFGGFALAGGRIIDRRKQRQMGADWTGMTARIRAAGTSVRWMDIQRAAPRILIAAVIYAILLWLHPWLFGVDPLT